jgi:hypothetical protein
MSNNNPKITKTFIELSDDWTINSLVNEIYIEAMQKKFNISNELAKKVLIRALVSAPTVEHILNGCYYIIDGTEGN